MENNDFLFDRTALLIGNENCRKLADAHVLVLGIGGVGGYALENLARAGIGKLTIIDGDLVDITNCNRQLSALTSTAGKPKTEVWAERIKAINPNVQLDAQFRFLRTVE
ncbi:MAG: ThiF family adenylyltransferase, partial [Lentisphaeria bacterium]|nr:ThiF family adenylyltransferase [Lentisphaeria bacterium]